MELLHLLGNCKVLSEVSGRQLLQAKQADRRFKLSGELLADEELSEGSEVFEQTLLFGLGLGEEGDLALAF